MSLEQLLLLPQAIREWFPILKANNPKGDGGGDDGVGDASGKGCPHLHNHQHNKWPKEKKRPMPFCFGSCYTALAICWRFRTILYPTRHNKWTTWPGSFVSHLLLHRVDGADSSSSIPVTPLSVPVHNGNVPLDGVGALTRRRVSSGTGGQQEMRTGSSLCAKSITAQLRFP